MCQCTHLNNLINKECTSASSFNGHKLANAVGDKKNYFHLLGKKRFMSNELSRLDASLSKKFVINSSGDELKELRNKV